MDRTSVRIYGVKADTKSDSCYYCNSTIDEYSRTVDHLIPESRGGIRANKNKVYSCKDCNTLKGDMTPEEFERALAAMIRNSNREHKSSTGRLRRIQLNVKTLIAKKNGEAPPKD